MRTRKEIIAEIKAVANHGRAITKLQNEGGEGYDHTDNAKIEELLTELDSAIVAEWDRETTIARRKMWNDARVMMGMPTRQKLQETTGIDMDELKAAVKRHQI
jgi:hypothetical protein